MQATFKVSPEVERAKKALKTYPLFESIARLSNVAVEAAGANLSNFTDVGTNPFVQAVHHAFDKHYPLTLSPDDIWLAIGQGFANHVNANAETLRKQFVKHEGQVTILQETRFYKGSPDNDWTQSFKFFSDEIEKHIGKKRDLLVSGFSTTGNIERAASEVVLMDAMQQYFKYRMMTMCGIPEITLLGSTADWKDVHARAGVLAEFGCGEWIAALQPILNEFVNASQGKVNTEFWQSFYKEGGGSGGPYLTGWINSFFPYVEGRDGKYNRPNPTAIDYKKSGFGGSPSTASLPRGISRIPFVWDYLGTEYNMEFMGGFVGASQDPESLIVRPAIGWAVRDTAAKPPPAYKDNERLAEWEAEKAAQKSMGRRF